MKKKLFYLYKASPSLCQNTLRQHLPNTILNMSHDIKTNLAIMEHIIKSTYPLHERMFQSDDIVPNNFVPFQIVKNLYSTVNIRLIIQQNFE